MFYMDLSSCSESWITSMLVTSAFYYRTSDQVEYDQASTRAKDIFITLCGTHTHLSM